MQTNVVMIVANPCTNDTRVIKEAELLTASGYNVTVLCRHVDGLQIHETRNHVTYIRLDMSSARQLKKILIGDDNSTGILGKTLSEYFIKLSKKVGAIVRNQEGDQHEFKINTPGSMLGKFRRFRKKMLKQACKITIIFFKLIALFIYGRFNFSNIKESAIQLEPDIIHIHDLTPLGAGVKLGKITGAKVIYDAHELERHRNGHGFFKRLLSGFKESRYVHHVSRVITVSESIADYLRDLYGIERPLVVLNVPDDVNKKTNDRDIRADIGLSPEVHLAVYVGKITFGRGLEQVIMALPHCPEVHFAMLGPKVVSTVDIITRLAEKYNVLNRVHVLDPVAPHEVISYLSTADTGVVPIQDVCLSYRFCMPNKLFELAIAGIPVAVSNLPDMRAFVEREGVGVVMDQTDPEDIARAIRETYQRREELILTSERLSDFRKKYSWQGQAEKLVQLYDGLAGNGQLQTGTARPAA